MIRTRFDLRQVFQFGATALAAFTLPFLTGCAKVFSLDGHMSTRDTAGPVAQAQWDVFMVTVWVTLFIFIVVGAVLAYAQIKFRAKNTADEHAEPPPQGHGNPMIEIGLIVASVALLVIIAIPTLKNIWYTHDVPESEKADAMEVNAIGYQWWFKFEYPSEKIEMPGGGEGILVNANELVVPVGVPVRVHLRTVDVIHSFWVPKLAGKVDMIPNRANFLWFKADKPGYYYGQCAEYCGESHAIMRFRVIALSPSDYVRWLEKEKAGARTATAAAIRRESEQVRLEFASMPAKGPRSTLGSTDGNWDVDPLGAWKQKQQPDAGENAALIAEGRQLFLQKQCSNCHTVRGHDAERSDGQRIAFGGITGPDLTHVGSRSTIAAGVLDNSPERLHQWLKDPNYFKPGNKMYYGVGGMQGYLKQDDKGHFIKDANGGYVRNITLNDQEIDALVAYLHSLK